MKLLRLILQGFKSFADRTEISFSDGLTMIVGPNGCGKSNISDAVRWVLGEQSIKSLRGQKAEDIIFSGSAQRKAKNGAEVTMVVDNSGHDLPLDTAEVSVTRRLLRNGDSDYLINQRSCRLRDVQELFANTGLGKGSLAIIGQNRVDQVLSARPEERRVIFEEVAGISRYRMRKEEGLGKLRRTAENMDRVKDLMALLEEQLVPMEKAAHKAQQMKTLLGEKQKVEASLSLLKLSALRRMLARYETEWRKLAEEKSAWDTKLSTAEAEQAALDEKIAACGEECRKAGELAQQKQRAMDQTSGDYRVRETALSHTEEDRKRIGQQLADGKARREALSREAEETAQRKNEAEAELLQMKARLLTAEQEREKLSLAAEEAERAYQAVTAAIQEKKSRLAWIGQELLRTGEEISRIEEDQKNAAADRGAAEKRRDAARKEAESLEKEARLAESAMKRLEKEGREKSRMLKEEQGKLALLMEQQGKSQARLERVKTQRIYLERADREYASFSSASRAVLQAREEWQCHVRGPLGNLLHVPPAYTTAAEAALGTVAAHIVTDTAEAAGRIIQWMKRRGAGRATFYPLDAMKPRFSDQRERQALKEPGIIGIAADLFQCDPDIEDLKRVLAGRILIAQDLDAARKAAARYGQRLYLVTLDGQIIRPGGSMTGGSMRKAENTFFGRKQEIEDLRREEEKLLREVEEKGGERKKKETEAAGLARQTAACRDAWQEAHVRMAACEGRRSGTETALAAAEESLSHVEALAAELARKREEAAARARALQKEKENIGDVPDLPGEENLAWRRKAVSAAADAETELRIACARKEELLARAEGEAKIRQDALEKEGAAERTARAEQEEKTARIETLKQEMKALFLRFEKEKQESACAAEEAARLRDEADVLAIRRSENDKERRAVETALLGVERKLAEKQGRIDEEKRLEKEELLKLSAAGLTERAAEPFRVPGNSETLGRRLADILRNIDALGPVNPNAEEEYALEAQRCQSYAAQLDDLEKAKAGLEKVVKEIDATMSAHFTEAFQAVNEEFSRIMNLMFQGGAGRLELTDRAHPLESGVELYLELPGKKRQPLSLMSGGERALTVIALLISFLAYRPAPFCFVDEIDAALDDANVERFSRMMLEYRNRAQFIVITHRKKTMEFADTLQGVTMKEKGVSTLVTVRMEDYIKEA